MIGLQHIVEIFKMEYKEVAEKIGVSKQTFQDWIKERRRIPQQRLEQLSKLFGIKDTELFQKELSGSEKISLQILYFQSTDVFEEVEVPYEDDDGKEYMIKEVHSEKGGIIDYLYEQYDEVKLLEQVKQFVRNDDEINSNKFHMMLLEQFLTLAEGTESQKRTIEVLLHALTVQRYDEWGGVSPDYSKLYHKGFFKKLNHLLVEYGLLTAE
ncbi:helix-turn-helix transcriptional regulator [Paenibacillus sp. UMB4589-SE434]|uniref:helix-turn-helix domain-containing protein n=1 Tax=Paenibacillus sp. UMB4589-SE434 TaxID=3046314 RepID=UPI00254EE3BB|nr:helix-turn-helix transcriptional regulator [Paenibacillus sp. UMB4589-SE434]MDK8182620.1 helix-turn-helix transcriptional regulator [Paenibacillus sp. UMB4589-SE434]